MATGARRIEMMTVSMAVRDIFACHERLRFKLLGLLLENVGADRAVLLGNPEVWRAAVRSLDDDSATRH